MKKKVFELDFHGRKIIVEHGELAKQADGAVLVRYNDTVVLTAAVVSKSVNLLSDFFPLTVNYQEKLYSVGKIPGGFIKREGRPSEAATLAARMIDRPMRPLFPEGFKNEVQVISTVLSVDQDCSPELTAMLASSLAVSISKIPFNGPIAGVKVGRVDGKFVINPTPEQLEKSELDLTVAGTKDAINMVESSAKQVPEDIMLEALMFGHKAVKELIKFEEKIIKEIGEEKMEYETLTPDEEMIERVKSLATKKMDKALRIKDKLKKYAAIDEVKEEVIDIYTKENEDILKEQELKELLAKVNIVLSDIEYQLFRSIVVKEKKRADGRKMDEIRPLSTGIDLLPRTHGSALFTRGETQALSITTLGALGEHQIIDGLGLEDQKRFMLHYNFPQFSVGETGRYGAPGRREIGHGALGEHQIIDGLGVEDQKRFMLHYNFPQFSVGETGRYGAPGRREIGHGALGEKALAQVIPSEEEFPYTIRVVSEILESNGSSSQASICAGCMSLMAAGVPIKAPVAGIAMGLITHEDDYTILTDIQGMEDHLGDMDFKVAGTKDGITALQMDIKIKGITEEILKEALAQAKKARLEILKVIAKQIKEPRKEVSKYAPKMETFMINPAKIKDVIGRGGETITKIICEASNVTEVTNVNAVKVDLEDDGRVVIYHTDRDIINKTKEMIESIVREVEVGKIYEAKVVKIEDFGCFVQLWPGCEGLVHVSQLADTRVDKVEDVVKLGDEIIVKALGPDKKGRQNFSRKDALPKKDTKKKKTDK